ncbi:endonuclease/exonuclease/phosphatase family protein [Saccharopolyspora sp. NPDC000359]|uniref:endonuclease/exonuclease/phosphatase family protein n=1 Tax=Saccharopolyspora sp. NPDC000359 TaxID=3154251 RepID=UPI003317CED4
MLSDDELDDLQARFDTELRLWQTICNDLGDLGDQQHRGMVRERVEEWGRILAAAGRIPPGGSWWVQPRIGTYNLHDYTAAEARSDRRAEQRALMRDQNVDIWCLQEILHPTRDLDDPELAELFAELCDELGMEGRLAWARSGCHTAVLWKPSYRLTRWRDFSHWPWHHTAGCATLDIGGRQDLHVVSAHFSPFSADQRAHEAQLLGAIVPSPTEWMIAGCDLNSPSVNAPEPYADQTARHGHEVRHQLHQRVHSEMWPATSEEAPVDRRAAQILDRHGLLDPIDTFVDHPHPVTSGHHPADPHGPRRPDCLRVTHTLLPGGGRDVVDHPHAEWFDHLPLLGSIVVPWRPPAPRSRATEVTSEQ